MFKKLDNEGFAFFHTPEENKNIISKLPPDLYDIKIVPMGLFAQELQLIPHKLNESLIEPNNKQFTNILEAADDTFNPDIKEIYKDLEVMNKLGIMLYGIPGTGKTSTTKLICKKICEKYNAICLVGQNHTFENIIDAIRTNDPDRNIIVFVDEFDKLVTGYNNQENRSRFIQYLDGTTSRNNIINIVCLNDYNGLANEFKNRPSRFRIVEEISYCDSTLIENYINKKIPKKYLDKINSSELSYKMGEFPLTIDQVKTIILQHIAHKKSIDELLNQYSKINIVNHSNKEELEEAEEGNDDI